MCGYLLTSNIVEQALEHVGKTAKSWNINPGYLEQNDERVAVWQINPETGPTFYLGFRTRERVPFPDAGEFTPVITEGTVLEFENGEKFQLVCWELAYRKEFVAFNRQAKSYEEVILVQDGFIQ